jgi:hypothetical protein
MNTKPICKVDANGRNGCKGRKHTPAVMNRNVQRKPLAERQHQKDTDGLAVNTYLI